VDFAGCGKIVTAGPLTIAKSKERQFVRKIKHFGRIRDVRENRAKSYCVNHFGHVAFLH